MERPSFTGKDTDAKCDERLQKSLACHSGESLDSAEKEEAKYEDTGTLEREETPRVHDLELQDGEIKKHLDTAEEIVTTVIRLEDDPTLNPWTFRMFFIGQS
jgi:hypothetical protein